MPAAGTQQSLRKYLGAIKDGTTVGLARMNSDYKELDVAIVRATNHVERPAKEKNIRAIIFATSASRPRADVAYCIHALAKRLSKTRNWAVALKTLIVIHRALREVYPSYLEELINYGRTRYRMLNLSHFKDDSSINAWDYSAFVRTYALYLEEKLECFRVLKYDVVMDNLKTRDLDTATLLVQLPALQQLLIRLLNCQPQGAALYNLVIRLALSMVVAESTTIYNAISDGTINLVEKFFEMQRHDALNALDIYRRAVQQSEMLKEFYEVCKSIGIRHGEDFTKIDQPQASFLTAMGEYIRDAPRASTFQKDRINRKKVQAETKSVPSIEDKKTTEEQETSLPLPEPIKVEAAPIKDKVTDLLALHEESPDSAELDNKNALALAIVPSDYPSTLEDATTGWELALVAVPSSNETAAVAANLGGLDKLTLDSMYDDAIRCSNQPTSYNPWEPTSTGSTLMEHSIFGHDAFFASNAMTTPFYAQMAAMAQHQEASMQHRQIAVMMGQQQIHQPGSNPFGNPFAPMNSNPCEIVVPKSSNLYAGFM